MDFKEKGWIRRYLHIRNQYALHKEFERLSAMNHTAYNPENFLYQLLQPTGVLYGHPAKLPLENKSLLRALRIESLSRADKTKIILLESFLHSALTSPRYQDIKDAIDMADAVLDATLLIGRFYKSVYKGLNVKYRHWFFHKARKGLQLSEFVLENKIKDETTIGNFWPSFFNTSLMFLDVLYFGKWIDEERSETEFSQMAIEHEEMRFLILKVIVAAALANHVIEPEERKLFDYYVKAAMFSEKTQSLCYQYLDNPGSLENLDFTKVSSQVLKKYMFELAILVIYADKLLTEEESRFIELLRRKLCLGSSEVESSQISVESFMISHWQQMEFLQNRDRLTILQEQVMNKMAAAISKNKDAFIYQIQSNPELAKLLKKASQEKLKNEEKNKIRQGLLEAIRALSSTMLSAIPKSFFTYSVLMQIIPENAVPVDNR